MRRHLSLLALFAGIWLAPTSSHAVPLDIDASVISNGTWDDPSQSGTTGDNGGFLEMSFEIDGSVYDITTLTVELSFVTMDHNFIIDINGSEVVPIDPNNPAVFSPLVNQPWNANDDSLPRIVMTFSPTGVEFAGTEQINSTSLTTGLVYAQPVATPGFISGTNTIRFENPDDVGPDGSVFSIIADAALLIPIPEPDTGSLLALGLCAVEARTRRLARRNAAD
jgi:hypothetical protein